METMSLSEFHNFVHKLEHEGNHALLDWTFDNVLFGEAKVGWKTGRAELDANRFELNKE